MKLLLSTHNQHKRRELSRLLPGHEVIVLPADFELPPEEGETFEQNALRKARAAADLAKRSGALAIADDSGIEAQALGGGPGVRSARYAGEHASDQQNLQKLIEEAPAGSGLRYVCALALVDPGGEEKMFLGHCEGRMATAPRGQRGFGYDPVFVPDGQPRRRSGDERGDPRREDGEQDEAGLLTMAELTDAEKDEISHRGLAVRALGAWLQEECPGD
jgi:XTP/dITP diphosphohydrolase